MDAAVVVALGSNLSGDYDASGALLEAAVNALNAAGLKVVRRSGWWRSAAWPNPADPAFINGVALVETALAPGDALAALHEVEHAFGRDRIVVNAPRTLDLDLIAYGRVISGHPMLPHPRAHERKFVMGPLAQIAPDWVHPVNGKTASDLAETAQVGADATPL